MDMDAHITHASPKPQLPQIARFSTVASVSLPKLCEELLCGILHARIPCLNEGISLKCLLIWMNDSVIDDITNLGANNSHQNKECATSTDYREKGTVSLQPSSLISSLSVMKVDPPTHKSQNILHIIRCNGDIPKRSHTHNRSGLALHPNISRPQALRLSVCCQLRSCFQ